MSTGRVLRISMIVGCLLYAALVDFLFVGSLSCNRQNNAAGERGAADTLVVAAEAVVISRGILNPYLHVSGVVAGINEAVVVSQTQGVIGTVSFELGDSVSTGTVLLTVDREQARLAMEQARQGFKTATMNLKAVRKLFADSAASAAELARAAGQYNGARAAYQAAAERYRHTAVTASISGRVASKEPVVAVGNAISPGVAVARIVDISRLRLQAAIGEAEVRLVAPGAAACVRVAAACPDSCAAGEVCAVSAGADPATGAYTVVIGWDNVCGGAMRAGMSATARIRTTQTDSLLIAPTAALTRRNDTTLVLAVSGGRVRLVPVATGQTLGNRTQVTDGLATGDTVLISRTTTLRQGDRVKAVVKGRSGAWR